MYKEYYFTVPGKESDKEPIIIYTRRHIVSFLGDIFIIIILLILPIVFGLIVYLSPMELSKELLVPTVMFISIYYLFLFTFAFLEWINYYYDILVVTDKTLINIEQKTIFSRHISHVHLLQIEDISSEIKGFIPTIFNYGDVIVQTAGANEYTIIKKISNPQKIAAIILELHKKMLEKEGLAVVRARRNK